MFRGKNQAKKMVWGLIVSCVTDFKNFKEIQVLLKPVKVLET
jgi:hypothetical protein